MKLLDQYIYAVGKKLPIRSRNEIKMELNSLLLDEIEGKYGIDATDEQVEETLKGYGSPREVANRYKSDHLVIGAGYTDLYFMIMKIIVFALTIAFTVTFFVELFTNELSSLSVIGSIAKIPLNVFAGSISAFGWLTIVFIILTRINNDQSINLEEDWSIGDIKDIQIGPETESKLGSSLSIFFTLIFMAVINVAPQLISLAERSFEKSGMSLGHYVDINVFRSYLLVISIVWIGEIVYHVINLYSGPSKNLALYNVIIQIASAGVMATIATSTTLYLNYSSLLGFKGVFSLIALLGIIEAITTFIKFIKYYVIVQ